MDQSTKKVQFIDHLKTVAQIIVLILIYASAFGWAIISQRQEEALPSDYKIINDWMSEDPRIVRYVKPIFEERSGKLLKKDYHSISYYREDLVKQEAQEQWRDHYAQQLKNLRKAEGQ